MSRRRKTNLSAHAPTQRQLRAGELVRHALVEILAREEFRDPALQGIAITIGEVRCSPDLRHANIFCSALGKSGNAGCWITTADSGLDFFCTRLARNALCITKNTICRLAHQSVASTVERLELRCLFEFLGKLHIPNHVQNKQLCFISQ